MPNVLDSSRNRAAAAFLALVAAIAGGTAYFVYSDDGSHVQAVWKVPQKHAPNLCYYSVTRAPSEVWDTLGLKVPEGTPALALVKVPFYESDACSGGKVALVDYKTAEPMPAVAEDVAWATLVSAAKTKIPIPEPKPVEPIKEEPPVEPVDPKAEPVLTDACATRTMMLPGGIEAGADEWIEPCGPDSVFEAWIVGHKDAPWRCSCRGADGKDYKQPCGCWTANCGIPAECCEDEFTGADGKPVECVIEGKCGNAKPCADPALECYGQRCRVPPGEDAGEAKLEADKPVEELLPGDEPAKLDPAALGGGK